MERPFDNIVKMAYGSLEKGEKNFIFSFNQNDKILVWIVGFSVTAITLIVSKIADLGETYESRVIKTILLLLIITLVSGIVYRIFALLQLRELQDKTFFLEGAFSREKSMPIEVPDLSEIDDIHEVHHLLKTDFGSGYTDVIDAYNLEQTEEGRAEYLDYLKDEYARLGEWAKKDYEYGIRYLKSVYKDVYGLSEKAIDKQIHAFNKPIYLKIYGWVCKISIFTCIISFITVLLILALKFE